MTNSWNIIDEFLSTLRFNKIKKYVPQNAILCDIGCGSGKFLMSISNKIKKGIGFDKKIYSKDLIKKFNNLEFYELLCDKCALPLPNESVDCVSLIAVLEHLDSPEFVLKETFRILKKGGILLITTPSPRSKPILEFLAFKLKIISQKEISDHKQYFSSEDLKNILIQSGFDKDLIKIKPFQCGYNIFCYSSK